MSSAYKLIRSILLLATLTGCAANGNGAVATPTMVPTPIVAQKPTYTVERGDVSKVLELRGRVVPVKQQELFFGTEGYIQEIYFNRGDTVQAGDLIARLEEPEQYESKLAAAELALTQAQVDLEKFKLDLPVKIGEAQVDVYKKQEELDKAQKAVDLLGKPRVNDPLRIKQAEATLAGAKAALDEAEEIYEGTGDLPEESAARITALNNLLNARRDYYAAVINVNYMNSVPGEVEIAKTNADLALAQAKYDRAVAELNALQQEGGPFDQLLMEARVKDAEAKVEEVKQSKENVELRAPFDGQVMSLGIAVGDQVTARKAVATLADPTALEISVIPTPQELADMGVGQSVVIRLTSQQGKELPGSVRLLPDTSSTSSQKDPSARMVPADPQAELTLNEAVTVIIDVETRPNVLWLPPGALRSFQGRDFVLVVEDGVQRRLDVRLGLKSADRIEVVSGLEEGQIVVGP
ncbi:MAG: HlyD family efflux transporter periplasmic adaptor subunit [Chloroflexota bacterium]